MESIQHSLFKSFLLLFVSLLFSKNVISQADQNGKIIAFHPSVGNSIGLPEKREFGLFTEYNDSLFESAQLIRYSKSNYSILISTTTGKSFERPCSIKELDSIYAAIDKAKQTQNLLKANEQESNERSYAENQQKKANRAETARIISEIAYQSFVIVLEILLVISLSN